MRTAMCHIRLPSLTQNRWHYLYASMTLLITLTYRLRPWTILTVPKRLCTVTWNRRRRSYLALSVVA
jgi:hypothetical protein